MDLRNRLSTGQRGNFALRVALILGTFLVLGAVVVVLVRSYQRDLAINRRRALQVSEHGLLQALDSLQRRPSWREGIARTSHRDGWFEVKVVAGESPSPSPPGLRVVSVGRSGRVVRKQVCELELYVDSAGSTWVQSDLRQE